MEKKGHRAQAGLVRGEALNVDETEMTGHERSVCLGMSAIRLGAAQDSRTCGLAVCDVYAYKRRIKNRNKFPWTV